MSRGKEKFFSIAGLLGITLACFGMCGCQRNELPKETEPDPDIEIERDTEIEVIDGGEVDHTDYTAPKEIESKDITDYYATFNIEGKWAPGQRDVFYTFEVKPDEEGVLMATESVTGVKAVADQALLTSLQEIIDEFELAEHNGEYRITAGIDPSLYGPSTLTVNYASGEELNFTQDNDPSEEWAKKTYLAFAKWFAGQGDQSLLPEEYENMVSKLSITFNDIYAGGSYEYSVGEERDEYGRLVLTRTVDGETDRASVYSSNIFFDDISGILSDHDLQAYASSSGDEEADLRIDIVYEDGHELSIHTSDEAAIDELVVMTSDLFDRFNEYF